MHKYERHPLSAKYGDIKGPAWEDFKENLKTNGLGDRKVTIFEGKVLDGWQLLRACREEGFEPEFQELPEGVDPHVFVETANDHRRHEGPELVRQRAEERRKRVAAARVNGHSLRTIADKEGVSKSQVIDDLKKSGGHPCTPEEDRSGGHPCTPEEDRSGGHPCTPEEDRSGGHPCTPEEKANGKAEEKLNAKQTPKPSDKPKVTGKDGKQYPANKPALCSRCERVGKVKDCPSCAKLAEKPAKSGKAKFDDRQIKDAIGKLARLFNDRANALGQQKSKGWATVRENMELLLASWDRWQLEGK